MKCGVCGGEQRPTCPDCLSRVVVIPAATEYHWDEWVVECAVCGAEILTSSLVRMGAVRDGGPHAPYLKLLREVAPASLDRREVVSG